MVIMVYSLLWVMQGLYHQPQDPDSKPKAYTLKPQSSLNETLTQRVHIHYYYGSRPQKTIPIMALGT